MTTNELVELNGVKTCIINNYLKGRLEKDFACLIAKGSIKIEKLSNTSHTLIVYIDSMAIPTRRQIFNHSLLKARF